jgi:hypothetical protein
VILAVGVAIAQPAPAALAPADPEPAAATPAPAGPASPPARSADPTVPPIAPASEPTTVTIGGYLQPQFRLREDSSAASDTDGFRFARARLLVGARTRLGELVASATVEAEVQPQFGLQDAYATLTYGLAGGGRLAVDVGQMRVPVSRQNLLSDARLSFVDKAQLATIAPARDLGARVTLDVPNAPVRVIGGAFNGEGTNQVENINQSYLFAARLEVTPIGRDVPLQEAALGPMFVTAAASYGHNRLSSTVGDEVVSYIGGDLAGAFRGLSGSLEYLRVQHRFNGAATPSYDAQGVMGQLALMLPVALPPLGQGRAEIGLRIEELDRNDTVPIIQPGDANQSLREYTVALSYYLRMHALKLQLAASRFTELEDRTATGEVATFPNDQLILQLTYRLE